MNPETTAEILICFITILILSFGIFSLWKKRDRDQQTIGIISISEGILLLILILKYII